MDYWMYTGNDLQEATTKANTAIELINEKGQEIFGGNVISEPQTFINTPTIDGVIYYCGFSAPPEIFVNGASADLITEYDYEWFRQNE